MRVPGWPNLHGNVYTSFKVNHVYFLFTALKWKIVYHFLICRTGVFTAKLIPHMDKRIISPARIFCSENNTKSQFLLQDFSLAFSKLNQLFTIKYQRFHWILALLCILSIFWCQRASIDGGSHSPSRWAVNGRNNLCHSFVILQDPVVGDECPRININTTTYSIFPTTCRTD